METQKFDFKEACKNMCEDVVPEKGDEILKPIDCVTCKSIVGCKIVPRKLRGCVDYLEGKHNGK